MTSFDGLDRRLAARLDEHAAPRAPEGLNEAITETIAGTEQRPAWATLERWIPVETRAQFGAVPRAIIVFALLTLLTLVVATAVAIGASNPPKLPPPFGPAGNGLLAFESGGDLYVVRPDGTDLRRITADPAWEGLAEWSRDGTKLAYLREPADGGPFDLVVTAPDGTDPRVVAAGVEDLFGMTWSADGTEIMYAAIDPERPVDVCYRTGDACGFRLYVARSDGSGSRMVGDPQLDARAPALSPDGVTVAFGGGEGANEALYLMAWDGSDIRRLETEIPNKQWAFSHQSWSPDGRRIATADGSNTGQSVWLVDLGETGALEAVHNVGVGFWPDFSADGRLRWQTTFGPAVIATPDEVVSQLPSFDSEATWSPDGARMAGPMDGELVIYEGEDAEVSVIAPAADEHAPAWQRVAE
jgi:hypothetical protein